MAVSSIQCILSSINITITANQPAEPYFQLSFLSFHAVLIFLFYILAMAHGTVPIQISRFRYAQEKSIQRVEKKCEKHRIAYFALAISFDGRVDVNIVVVVVVVSLMTFPCVTFVQCLLDLGTQWRKEERGWREKNANQSIFHDAENFRFSSSSLILLFPVVWMKLMFAHMALEFWLSG